MKIQHKSCRVCGHTFPQSAEYFFEIRSAERKTVRWESTCKSCKRKRRNAANAFKDDDGVVRSTSIVTTATQDLNSALVSATLPDAPRLREDGEVIYKEYQHANGNVLQLTKAEFETVVDLFRLLNEHELQQRSINTGRF